MPTIKTIKLKKVSFGESQETIPVPADAPVAAEAAPSAPPPPGLEPASSRPKVSGRSFMLYALFAVAATVFCLAIIGMQYTEWSFFKADPSVWPVK